MTNGAHPPKKDVVPASKKAKVLKSRKSRTGAKSRSRLETLLQGRA
jgi:hypothetical protein